MKKFYILILIFSAFVWLWSGCSDDKNPLPSKSHPDEWAKMSLQDNHGAKVKQSGLVSCAECHGKDYKGGVSKVSCFKCHADYPHAADWMAAENSGSHGKYAAAKGYDLTGCQPCHGKDYLGGDGKESCFKCHTTYPHVNDWLSPGKEKFHGVYLQTKNFATAECQVCHGADFKGGPAKDPCFKCHASYPHSQNWLKAGDAQSHGVYLESRDWTLTSCQGCHRADLSGGTGKQPCTQCHSQYPHQTGWSQAGNAQFHGTYLQANNWSLANCSGCHGPDYTAGTDKESCGRCHDSYPHAAGWTTPGNVASHGQFISNNNWSMDKCKTCHGADYKGGASAKSCYACHTNAGGPESCNLCHGGSTNNAPPRALNGKTAITEMGVGRHQFHVVDRLYRCELCHVVPQKFNSPGHIDDTANAEILALWKWDRNKGTCETGCHANNPNLNYVWNHP
jgi:hypothetical protein